MQEIMGEILKKKSEIFAGPMDNIQENSI